MDGRKRFSQDDRRARSMPSPAEILRLAAIERAKRPQEGRKARRSRSEPGGIREYTWLQLGLDGPLDLNEEF